MADITFADVAKSTREISFDRFVTPAFYFGGILNYRLTISATNFIVQDISVGPVVTSTLNIGGTGYIVGDIITIINGDNDFTIQVATVNLTGVITSYTVLSVGTACTVSLANNVSGGTGTGGKINISSVSATEKLNLLLSDYPTLQDLTTALLVNNAGIPFSYAASFIGSELSTSLLRVSNVSISTAIPIYRTYFFGDSAVDDMVRKYLVMESGLNEKTVDGITNLDDVIKEFPKSRIYHMALWVAFYLVDRRRLYEIAADALGQSTFSFSNTEGLVGAGNTGGSISMKIGDVFSLEDTIQTEYNEGERPWAVGADNVLGDAQTFWYKLQLWIRQNMETMFGDFSLRRDTVMMGKMSLERDQNFYAFYDQYPYTISPLSRDILSSMSRM